MDEHLGSSCLLWLILSIAFLISMWIAYTVSDTFALVLIGVTLFGIYAYDKRDR